MLAMAMAVTRALGASVYAQLNLLSAGAALACVVAFFMVKPVLAWLALRMSLIKQGKQLPPGSMGFLWLGETLFFLSSLRQGGPAKFVTERAAKFRSLTFKTNLFLHPTVVVQGADANRFLAQGENKQELRNSWPACVFEVLGWNSPPAVHGLQHKRQRQIMNACLGPAALQKVVGKADGMTQKHIGTWWRDGVKIGIVEAVRHHAFRVAYSLLLGAEEANGLNEMEGLFQTWIGGLAGVPLDVPGTKYRKAKRARDALRRQIDRVIQNRQQQLAGGDLAGQVHNDLLSQFLLARDENGDTLDLEELRDVTLFLLFAGHDTTATALTFALKFIEENPTCHHRLVQEHKAIASHKKLGESITWMDITNMKYTWTLLQETLRLRPPAFVGVRETLKDVDYDGYIIPKGWKILIAMFATHENDRYFKHPSKFDPSRFDMEQIEKGKLTPLSFVAFGLGPHACKGVEFARMSMSLYIHHLIIGNHKWTSLVSNETCTCLPMLTLTMGYPVLVSIDKNPSHVY